MSETDALQAADVALYLEQHPDFFEQHAQLLAQIRVPHPHGGGAIPLSERQVLSLRDKNRALETKLGELIRFGEENDDIGERVHRLALSLLNAASSDAVLTRLQDSIRDDFGIAHVGLRLWAGAGDRPEFQATSEELQRFAQELPHPYCGPNDNFEAVAWFGDIAPLIRSVAFIALRDGERAFGLLALASEDAGRFYAGMGTLYLRRIGEMAGAALMRAL